MSTAKEVVRIDPEIAELVPVYVENLRKGLEDARAWLRAGDFPKLTRLGHGWKGSGESYGFPTVTSWGASLEQAARDGDGTAAEKVVDALAEYLGRIEIRFE